MRCFLLPCLGSKIKKSSNPPPPKTFVEENHVEETMHYIAQLNAEVVVVKNCDGYKEEKTGEKKEVPAIKDIVDECSSDSLFSLSIDYQVSLHNVEVNSPMQKLPTITKVECEEQPEGAQVVNINPTLFQQESSDSLFSLSIDSRKRTSSPENVDGEVNSLVQGMRIEHDDSTVLNPIENIITKQGSKMVKSTVCKMKENKENINLVLQDAVDIDHIPISPDPNLKLPSYKTMKKQEIGVDTSLSCWLVEPETTPVTLKSSNSDCSARKHTPKEGRGSLVLSNEDRPILGALSIEKIRKYSSVSATSSRSKSPDELPIIGTVGSYWSHTGQSMDSELDKHTKDARLKCNSAIKRKLERTFEDEFKLFPVQ